MLSEKCLLLLAAIALRTVTSDEIRIVRLHRDFHDECQQAHNAIRRDYCVAPLSYDRQLTNLAAAEGYRMLNNLTLPFAPGVNYFHYPEDALLINSQMAVLVI